MNHEEQRRLARRETLFKMAASGVLGAGGILGLVRDALAAACPKAGSVLPSPARPCSSENSG